MSNFILRKTHRLQAVAGLTKAGKVAPPARNVTALAFSRKPSPKVQALLDLPDFVPPSKKGKSNV